MEKELWERAQGDVGREEVRRIAGRLKIGKTSGTDGISAEMIKY